MRVALSTPELWNNTFIDRWSGDHAISLHEQWLLCAKQRPVILSIDFGVATDDRVSVLQKFLSTFQIKKLRLVICAYQLMELSKLYSP